MEMEPRSIDSLQLAQQDQEMEEEASKASAAAKEPESKIAERVQANLHSAKEQTAKPKPKLTRMQKEIADYNKPPLPRTDVQITHYNKPPIPRTDEQITQEPEEITKKKSNSHLSRRALSHPPEDLMVAGARILAMIKKDSPERRRAYKILEEMKTEKAREQEETKILDELNMAKIREQEETVKLPPASKPTVASENPFVVQHTPALSPNKNRQVDDNNVPQKSKLVERDLTKLAPLNNYGKTDLDAPTTNPTAKSENPLSLQQAAATSTNRKRKRENGNNNVPQKSSFERELAKLAPYNSFGRTELGELSRRRRRDF
ncbi:hypothetical protein E6O75_ATG08699 [Venturia nashicola]|uniref:Uncharacterized protein n=1 Tax=Venturia nashicola TaxID=86259 RepID=A0A4Z1NGH0_9PEZI|nr:hypothetical protein E6O75_ATG08699 [Venturia nashicola]